MDYRKTNIRLDLVDQNGSKIDTFSHSIVPSREYRSIERCKQNGTDTYKLSTTLLENMEGYNIYATPKQNACTQPEKVIVVLPPILPPTVPPIEITQVQTNTKNATQTNPQSVIAPESVSTKIAITSPIEPIATQQIPEKVIEKNVEKIVEKVAEKTPAKSIASEKQTEAKTSNISIVKTINQRVNQRVNQTISPLAYSSFVVSNNSLEKLNTNFDTNSDVITALISQNLTQNYQQIIQKISNQGFVNKTKNSIEQVAEKTIWNKSNSTQKITYLDQQTNQTKTVEVDNFSIRTNFIYFNVAIILFLLTKTIRENISQSWKLAQSVKKLFQINSQR
jgi:hypothetical protein